MYKDQRDKSRRSCNVIVTGLTQPPNTDDKSVFGGLILKEFNRSVDIKYSKRIGKVVNDRPQKLLITLSNADDAAFLIGNAKSLRKSNNEYVRSNIYINSDLTPAEALAAYELRCARRERKIASQQQQNSQNSQSSSVVQASSGNQSRSILNDQLNALASPYIPGATATSS